VNALLVGRRGIPRVVILQKYLAPYRVPLFSAMANTGEIELVVVCFGKPERRRQYVPETPNDFQVVQPRGWSIPTGYESNVEIPLGLRTELRRLSADVIVCAPDWGGMTAFSQAARRVIWSEATTTTEEAVSAAKRAFRRHVYSCADAFAVPGRLARSYIEAMGGRAPFVEVRNSIDERTFRISDDRFARKFAAPERRTITFSGSLVDRKGVVLLLEAFAAARSRHPDAGARAVLQIIGAGPIDLSNRPRANVEFSGHLDGVPYREAMQRSHVFVMPSVSDCNPLVLIEALYCGCALIVSDGVGSYPEVVRDNGRLVARGNLEQLTDALSWAITAPDAALRAFAERSRVIGPQFDTSRAATQFLRAVTAGASNEIGEASR
jgi:glycosyltransferase involved in cell wall biosynthesis